MSERSNPFNRRLINPIMLFIHPIVLWIMSKRSYQFYVSEQQFPPEISFLPGNIESISARDAFFCAGYLTTPVTEFNSYRIWGFLIEHLESISRTNRFMRISEDLKRVDERIRTIFVERFAVGLTGWMLWKRYNITHIADAGYFINKKAINPNSAYNNIGLGFIRNGSTIKPDFFCLTNLSECVIAESKGGIGAPSVINPDLDKGKQQVSNVIPTGVSLRNVANRLVFGSYFRYENVKVNRGKDSGMIIRDPTDHNPMLEIPVSEKELILISYLKLFNFCGLGEISKTLKNRSTVPDFPNREIIMKTKEFSVLPLLTIEYFVIGIHADVAAAIFRLDFSSIKVILKEYNLYFSSTSERLILPNGIYIGNI
ncbi:MAG: hypothetical protein ACM3MI_04390 [Clostridiales bacterium]